MKRLSKALSVVTATAIVAANFATVGNHADAEQTSGTAPYINQWAVSGPFTNPVVDNNNVVPVIGQSFADPNSTETSTWKYFDDRIFNSNYDDYNDLMGYFDVKQGENTTNKWVVAST